MALISLSLERLAVVRSIRKQEVTVNDPIFGEVTQNLGHLERQLSLEFLGSDFSIILAISCWDDEEILPDQRNAFEKFMASNLLSSGAIEEAIFTHYLRVVPEIRERTGQPFASANVPDISSPYALAGLIKPTDLLIKRTLDAPKRIVGLLFDCTWDIDNGLAVRIENEKIVEVGSQDIVL
ncbi:MAG: hypothetical protein ABJK59_11045 [Erythrobacter sp.]|uniref:DUF6985 domain-containing protein n=1 Tax=Erythrobacter sp. TaxID=1042 RepID=UPI0032990F2A